MGVVAFSMTQTFESCGPCITCGVEVILPQQLKRQRVATHENFYCCNGHAQCYTGKTELQKAQELLETERRWREQANKSRDLALEHAAKAQREASAARGVVTRIKNRVGNGVCPCCNRSFTNLQRHMHTKHPDFKNESSA